MRTLLLVFIIHFTKVSCSTGDDTFDYRMVYFQDDEWIVSEVPDIEHEKDEWPYGAYTLLMSKHGCPRGRWNRGYLSFNWQNPHLMLSHTLENQCITFNTTMEGNSSQFRRLLSEKTWPVSQSYMFGPFSEHKMTLNFCQRVKNADSKIDNSNNTWPRTNFRIFDANNDCPSGFNITDHTLILPPVITWEENGYLPRFIINTDHREKTILTLKECVRDILDDANNTANIYTNGSAFILLKHEDHPCPVFNTYDVWPESVSLVALQKTSSDVSNIFHFCFYQPERWNECKGGDFICNDGKCIPKHFECDGYENCMDGSDELECGCKQGQFECGSGECVLLENRCDSYMDCEDGTDEDSCENPRCGDSGYQCENGFCIPIRYRCDGYYDCNDGSDEYACECDRSQFRCDESTCIPIWYICDAYDDCRDGSDESSCGYELRHVKVVNGEEDENDKTYLDYVEQVHTLDCSENEACFVLLDLGRSFLIEAVFPSKVQPFGLFLKYIVQASNDKHTLLRYGGLEIARDRSLNNHVEGRFIAFVLPNFNMMIKRFIIQVFVKNTDAMCMIDIGMIEGRITSDQITTTDKSPVNIDSFRAYNSGWCTSVEDKRPYIQVDLLETTLLDGITIYNWYKTETNVTNGIYSKYTIPMGIRSFTLFYSSSGNQSDLRSNKTFSIDMFRPVDEPQTVIFYEQIKTRYVRIVLIEPITSGRFCIKFELHGCRNIDAMNRPSFIHSTEYELFALVAAVRTLTSPTQLVSIANPFLYHDGAAYIWILDFRSIGFVKLMFKELFLLPNVEQGVQYSYRCNDEFTIAPHMYVHTWRRLTGYWTIPASEDVYKNMIIETQETYLALEFLSCYLYTPRLDEKPYFIIYVEKTDIPSCASINVYSYTESFTENRFKTESCTSPMMLLTTMSLKGVPSKQLKETWQIKAPKSSVLLTITYFHLVCDVYFTGSFLEVSDQFSAKVSYNNCNRPPTTLLSESEIMQITYVVGEPRLKHMSNILMVEGFQAIYSVVNTSHQVHFQDFETADKKPDKESDEISFLIHKACSLIKCYTVYTGTPRPWKITNDDCSVRGKQMVSINSKQELTELKHLLRSLFIKNVDDGRIVFSTYNVDPNYFVHIGMLRTDDESREFIWQDGSPVIFSAWNTGEPNPDDECARMSFHMANKNNTWEAVDCYVPSALYHVCEEPADNSASQNLNVWTVSSYTGHLSTTVNELTCQRWDSQSPHSHSRNVDSYFPDDTVSDAANFCRDPNDEEGALWCYTTDINIRWDYCKLTDTVSDRCYETHYPYIGTVNVTYFGLPCLRWDSPELNPAEFKDTDFPDGNKSLAGNYCRDPTNVGYTWCYTADTDARTQMDLCNVEGEKSAGTEIRQRKTYTCSDGHEISTVRICNGIVDCVDARDELNCDHKVHALLNKQTVTGNGNGMQQNVHFICGSNETISFIAVCDRVIDCIDGTDEINCDAKISECSTDEIRCGDGNCIHASLMCDFIPHCADFSDEDCDYPECTDEEFRCTNGQCIPMIYRCNAYEDCFDGTDEESCDSCSDDFFHCDLTRCIPKRFKCDSIYDCRDRDDEIMCTDNVNLTCEDRWLNGWRQNGIYTLMNSQVECDFDNVEIDGSILTKFHTTEWRNESNLYIILDIKYHQDDLDLFLNDDKYECRQTFTQTCTPAALSMAATVDPHFENEYRHCQCVALTVIPYSKDNAFVHECNNKTHILLATNISVRYYYGQKNERLLYLRDELSGREVQPILDDLNVNVGLITCKSDGNNNSNMTSIACEENGFTYPARMKCVFYETYDADNKPGCRSGSHLKNCGDFICPDGMIKCPGSYCVPLKYICDGKLQCPRGEDERGCGCNNDDLELILIVSAEEFLNQDSKLLKLSDQFKSHGASVRIVYYSVHTNMDLLPFEHQILYIYDINVDQNHVKSRQHACSYNILANLYIESARFKNVKSRGMIFIQGGTESQTVAQHMFMQISKPDFDIYRVILDPSYSIAQGEEDEFNYVTDITVDSLHTLISVGSRVFTTLCKDSLYTLCQDNYKCSSSKLCIPRDHVCDGRVHCPLSDDEMFCDFVCPTKCSCSGYNVNCRYAGLEFTSRISQHIDERVRVLDLSTNVGVGEIIYNSTEDSVEFPYLISLNLSACSIKELFTNSFDSFPNLRSLDLSQNKISIIPRQTFYGLSKLIYLNLNGNEGFMVYEPYAFFGLSSLRHLVIMNTDVRTVSAETFFGLNLDTLQVNHNNILEIKNDAFSGLTVSDLIFESNILTTFDSGIFNGISGLTSLRTTAYKYCCVRPRYLEESACFPQRDEFSSCEDLMRNSVLQTWLWLMGLCAVFGNVLAILYRVRNDREKLKRGHGIFVTNLAVADLFMGVYLLIIAIADVSFRNIYTFEDEYWRNSSWCIFAGALSTLSSEASVMFMCLITFDRFLVIKYPFSRQRFTWKIACLTSSVAWILSISISVAPLIAKDYFRDKFYSKSGVCVALPLTRDRPPGWLYSVIIFIGFNFVTFIGIGLGQLFIFLEINKVSSKIAHKGDGQSKARRRKELVIARNLLFVIATDFICWFPICFMGIMAISDYVIPGEVYAWVTAFILPFNSALNPVLYTFTAVLSKRGQHDAADTSVSTRVTVKRKKITGGKKCGKVKIFSYFTHKCDGCNMMSLDRMIKQDTKMMPEDLLKLTTQLAKCLLMLHRRSFFLEALDTSCVFVTLEDGKIIGNIQVRQEPEHGATLEIKTENIFALGYIILRLLDHIRDTNKAEISEIGENCI